MTVKYNPRKPTYAGVRLLAPHGDVSKDPAMAAMAVRDRIGKSGKQLVIVTKEGSVHLFDSDDIRADLMLMGNTYMCAGSYSLKTKPKDLVDDMIATWKEQRVCV